MIGIDFLAAHMLGDYILQTHDMSQRKLTHAGIRALHVTIYTLCFVPFLWLLNLPLDRCVLFLALCWITHFITDSRRWRSGEQWPPLPILVDQSIHAVTLAVLAHVCFSEVFK